MVVTVVQVYFYSTSFPGDSKTLKSIVYGLFILDVLQTALVTADAFHWFAYGFGNMDRLNDAFLNSWDVPLLDSVISLVVPLLLLENLCPAELIDFPGPHYNGASSNHILNVRDNIAAIQVSVTQCCAGIVTAVKAYQLGKLSLISTEVVEQTIWLVGSAVADLAIAVVLAWTLLRARNKGFRQSHSVLTRIVNLTVETNALTAGVAIVGLILFLAVPQHSTLVVPP
ncbi:hypothetical protein B0H17DRAFT_1205888 [Mycena rosella]|uniref:DUF6534 domain-containing protein n=1 Tax=Mycena rosella TaxID=1033263 RepID=A0AAD7D7Q5_MYCRO|nr:hypothetical protein B0H17DRAFT_1205888 [Mycena rosella]